MVLLCCNQPGKGSRGPSSFAPTGMSWTSRMFAVLLVFTATSWPSLWTLSASKSPDLLLNCPPLWSGGVGIGWPADADEAADNEGGGNDDIFTVKKLD